MQKRDYLAISLIVIATSIFIFNSAPWSAAFGLLLGSGLIHLIVFERRIWPKYTQNPKAYSSKLYMVYIHAFAILLAGIALIVQIMNVRT